MLRPQTVRSTGVRGQTRVLGDIGTAVLADWYQTFFYFFLRFAAVTKSRFPSPPRSYHRGCGKDLLLTAIDLFFRTKPTWTEPPLQVLSWRQSRPSILQG